MMSVGNRIFLLHYELKVPFSYSWTVTGTQLCGTWLYFHDLVAPWSPHLQCVFLHSIWTICAQGHNLGLHSAITGRTFEHPALLLPLTPNSWVCQNHPSADLTMFSWYVNLSATFPPSKPNLDLKVHYYNYNCLYIYPLLSVPSSPLNLPGKVWVLHGSILCSHPVYAYSWTSLEKNSGWC